MSTLKEKYQAEVRPALMQRFSYKNILEVPRLEKVVINMGVGAVSYTHLDVYKRQGRCPGELK